MEKEFTFAEYYATLDKEVREKIEFETQLVGIRIEARDIKGLSDRDLAELSGLSESTVANMVAKTTPKLDTLFKLLVPLGYTLKIVPLENGKEG